MGVGARARGLRAERTWRAHLMKTDEELMVLCRCGCIALAHKDGDGPCECGCPEFRAQR